MQPTAHTTSHSATREAHHEDLGFWRQYVFSTDHKVIGIQYTITALLFTMVGLVYDRTHTRIIPSMASRLSALAAATHSWP